MITKLTVTDKRDRSLTLDRKDANTPAYGFADFMNTTGKPLCNTKSVEVTVNDIAEYEQICKLCDETGKDMIAVIYDPT